MDTSELDSYREQVATIETALQADPNNTELQNLKTELLDLISLTESLQQQEEEVQRAAAAAAATASSSSSSAAATPTPSTPPSASSVTAASTNSHSTTKSGSAALDPSKQPIYQPTQPVRQWAVGDKCRALYPEDGRYYEATILNIGGGGQVFSVQYKGYESSPPGVLGPQDLKPPHPPKHQKPGAAAAGAGAEAGAGAGAGAGTEGQENGKKKRSADDVGPGAAAPGMKKKKHTGPSEQVQKQQAWQNFAKGAGAKKTKGAAPILKKSIFASPDTLDGKVGVVGSGKGMTQFQQRGKHIYANQGSAN